MARKNRKRTRGQSTIEYILMVAFGVLFSVEVIKIFNGIFQEGLVGLERNVQTEMATGNGFIPGSE